MARTGGPALGPPQPAQLQLQPPQPLPVMMLVSYLIVEVISAAGAVWHIIIIPPRGAPVRWLRRWPKTRSPNHSITHDPLPARATTRGTAGRSAIAGSPHRRDDQCDGHGAGGSSSVFMNAITHAMIQNAEGSAIPFHFIFRMYRRPQMHVAAPGGGNFTT